MADKTGIAWTHSTWNPLRGCSRVSAGCINCYAERQAIRHAGPGRPYEGLVRMVNGHPTWTGQITLVPEALDQPLRWRKPRRIFVNSMSDLFHEGVPDEFIDRVFAVMALCPQHTFQVLTKRPARMRDYLRAPDLYGRIVTVANNELRPRRARLGGVGISDPARGYKHVHLGVSVEDQASADERIPLLLQTPAALRFVSYEPALGPVNFTRIEAVQNSRRRCGIRIDAVAGRFLESGCAENRIDWLIVGGESGPGARACDVAWIRSAVQQCKAAGVPVFVKQLGVKWYVEYRSTPPIDRELFRSRDRKGANPAEWPRDLRVQEFPS